MIDGREFRHVCRACGEAATVFAYADDDEVTGDPVACGDCDGTDFRPITEAERAEAWRAHEAQELENFYFRYEMAEMAGEA